MRTGKRMYVHPSLERLVKELSRMTSRSTGRIPSRVAVTRALASVAEEDKDEVVRALKKRLALSEKWEARHR